MRVNDFAHQHQPAELFHDPKTFEAAPPTESAGRLTSARIAYWIFNYMPFWEAVSKEIQILVEQFGTTFDVRLISLNQQTRRLQLRGIEKYLPLPYSLVTLPILYRMASGCHINHLFASGGEWLLSRRLSRLNSVLTIAKDSSLNALERNRHNLTGFRYVVVQSERHREIVAQCGVDRGRIRLVYPSVEAHGYECAQGQFTILFASSPWAKHKLLTRGMFLLAQVAKRLPDVRFLILWRKKNYDGLRDILSGFSVRNVTVINDAVLNLDDVYNQVHATIIPGLEYESFKPSPRSLLESLAYGKPVLVSDPTSLAELVGREGCGVTFVPAAAPLEEAIRELRATYLERQKRCHAVVHKYFSKETMVRSYRELYDEMLKT